ncbi:rootletin [Plutella xylostella]|uniref:rootletin n=1 Tax=Plutella xylostella TaxID=51655 RepID=UPI00203307F4|nr:rootletin [Plutella xylostella]
MPLPAREGLTTPRSARTPIGRRTSTLPHQRLKKEKSLDSPPEMDSPVGSHTIDLRRQNEELRARLAGEAADHKRRLDAYRRAQQGQAALVSRLQSKVLQYKQRCSELETQLESTPRSEVSSYRAGPSRAAPALPAACAAAAAAAAERIEDLETALRRLDEEKRKCEKLVAQNNSLRDQLEESHQLNEALTNDLQKLTNDWEGLRDEMSFKEDEWKDEEQAFNEYYTGEHNRLLNLWREVVSVKRHFSDLQTSTERDVLRMKSDLESAARELVGTLSGYSIHALASQGMKGIQPDASTPHPALPGLPATPAALESLRVELRNTSSQRDAAAAELRERDSRIQKLLVELQGLEERCERAEVMCAEANITRSALEDIARALIQDSEADAAPSHNLLLSDRSPKRAVSQAAATAFAESTISAVQAALHKYQIQIHELQVKLQNSREQLMSSRKHCETADATVASLEHKLRELTNKLDEANADINQLTQEKDSLQKNVESLRADKNNLERNRLEVNAMVESLSSDYEKLQKINGRLEKTIESLENEKKNLQGEIDQLHREAANRESVLRAEEEQSSQLRSSLARVRSELHASSLCRDLLEQQRDEAAALRHQAVTHNNELQSELERVLAERTELQALADRLQAALRTLEDEQRTLLDENKRLEEEKSSISNQSSDQLGDLNSLRKEIVSAEQHRMDLEADKASLHEKIKFMDADREKLEMELRQVVRDRGELTSQLTAMARKKDTLNEEIMRLQQRLEQANETIGRLNRALEDHVKDGEEKQILIDTLDKDKQHLAEQLAALRSEKDALEATLFDTCTLLEEADAARKKLQKETHAQAVLSKGQIDNLTRDLEATEKKLRDTRSSLQQQSGKKEAEYQQLIANINRSSAENITKLKEEKEQLRQALEQKLSQTIIALTSEKEGVEAGAREREKKLLAARDAMILQHDEALLRAENDKQQALLMAHQEHQAILERLEESNRALDIEQNKLERMRRDAQARADQDRNTANQLKDELANMKARLEEAKAAAEDESLRYENRIKELHLEKEAVNRECTEIRAQLALAEDKFDTTLAQLHETVRKLKELENESDSLRKELTDVRRQLSNCSAERDKYNSSCRELREHVKRAEAERRDTARALDDAFQKIAALEETRTSLELERTRLQNQLKESESGGEHITRELKTVEAQLKRERAALQQAQHDAKELQSRLQNECEERERCAADAGAARRHAAELEAMLGCARGELAAARQRAAELGDACSARDQELVLRMEDCRSKERRLEELKHNLEVCLADATQQIQELKARLGGSEGRCRALEASLAHLEAGKRDVEAKLSSIAHTLRRICGVHPDGSVQAAARRRLASPARRYSPHRGRDHSEDRNDIIDVDPDLIKKGVRNLMHEVCQIEREKDDYKSQLAEFKKQLKEQQGKGDNKIQSVTASLRNVQEEKARLQSAVAAKDAQINALNESVQTKSVEISTIRDKVTSLEASLTSISEEKLQFENKAESLRIQLSERIQEATELRTALQSSEQRCARLDVRRASLEGDLQRARQLQGERARQMQQLQERCDQAAKAIASLEDRCTSLKGTVEQLSTSLQKAATAESDLRSEVNRLTRQLAEAKNNENNAVDKLRQLQKSVTNCENEKRVYSEKLESAKTALSELKRLNATLEDQVHRLTNQLANVEVQRSGLESQLRMTTWDGKESVDSELERELHALQRERSELKAKCDALQDTVRKMEAERRMNCTTIRSKSHDRTEKSVYYSDIDSGPDSAKDSSRCYKDSILKRERPTHDKSFSAELSLLEIENRELKMKIRRLEKELADKESELSLIRDRFLNDLSTTSPRHDDAERYRQLLQAREASHRQLARSLETQVAQLRQQLNAEVRRRQAYVSRSGRAARDVQRLRAALGDSLSAVAQDPALDSYTLEHEARKLDSTLAHSLPPLNDSYDSSK